MNRTGRLALILLMFFVLVSCDLFGTTTTTTQAVTTQTTVTATTRITTTAVPTTTVVITDSPLTVQLKYIYNLAVEASAFTGTYEEWLETVRGPEGAPGEDGKEVTMRVAEGAIQWQYSGDTTWTNLVLLSSLVGPSGSNGKEVTFKVEAGFIQWQYIGDTTWTNLIELSTLTGSDARTELTVKK